MSDTPKIINVKVHELVNCARCGGAHEGLTFELLTNPIDAMTHWALCPTLMQPILLKNITKEAFHA